ncbi:hypothetical protein [Noviherbaspirillum sedimenti]|uniref:Uncharacterized protein n=1 Tax=Noviherbaspirillum sedimenti TaxID=2320865 RepID=A0A3A3G1Y2_9BURK|nr:hypothetical protein [Noviherbaspirillum sedimenti]RJG00839.1 hypothetical protein D3878_03945 [Noviherbaspirillum sedimenti]
MKMALGKLSLMALLAVGMTAALARPAHDWHSSEAARLERQLEWAQASQARRGDDGQQQFERRGGGDGREGRDNGQFRNAPQQQGGYGQAPPQDDGRRGGRMSPEERRELRRQIDEAGRNIYAPRGR